MKSSLQWMKEYVRTDYITDPQAFADRLTIAGIPVEAVETWGNEVKKVISGKILQIEKHPDADKLTVCQVDMGEETLQIVTGAKNIAVGNIVPVAVHGAHLPGGVKIKKSKLRGVPSFGMFCSAKEFGFDDSVLQPEEREGIWILPDTTPIGTDLVSYLGLEDVVYTYELTPNRADCFSMVGLSREFAVLGKACARYPEISVHEGEAEAARMIHAAIEEPALCSRYAVRVLTDVQVGPSPLWMQMRLRKSGVRPVNNIVDVTNYVMLELGLPLHAYDYDKIHGHSLYVRRARAGETLKTLDEVTRKLTPSMLVIADADAPVCLAGIMGGADAEVTARTKTVVLECASFKGSDIRHTGRALGLRSEASARFERGVDAACCRQALDRCAQWLQQMSACETAKGIVDVYPQPEPVRKISFTAAQINDFLGTSMPPEEMTDLLRTLQFDPVRQGETIVVTVPSYRGDCAEMADIAEEVARIYGYERIPSTRPWSRVSEGTESREHAVREKISQILSDCGLQETVTFSFMNEKSLHRLQFPAGDDVYRAVPILNPITEEYPLLRTTLLPSLLDVLVRNQAVKNDRAALYEIAAVYQPKALPLTEQPSENIRIAGLLYGKRLAPAWNRSEATYDFYDVKGVVEAVLQGLGIAATLQPSHFAPLHPGRAAAYVKDGQVLCRFGELHPRAAEQYDVAGPVYLFDFDFVAILPFVQDLPAYSKPARFPAMSRDLAFLAPESVTNRQITDVIQQHGGSYLERVSLFDLYQGAPVPQGYKSLAYSLVFRSPEGTLADADIQEALDAIIATLKVQLNCQLRES